MAQKLKLKLIGFGALLMLTSLLSLVLPDTAWADIGSDCVGKSPENCLSNQPFISDINAIVDVLTALVGVVVVGVIILGGIQYSAAGDNPQAVSAARKRITNGLIALIAFLLTAAFLQWVIPGGLFNS